MIISRTPFRISFFGGGTDYPAWYRKNGGAVLATTINKYCYVSCRHLPPFFDHKHRIVYSKIENVSSIQDITHPAARAIFNWAKIDTGVEVHHDGDLPARSGLGSSSSFTVGLVHAFNALSGKISSKELLANAAIDIEQNLIGESVGSQDQISAAFGGFNLIHFNRDDSFSVTPVILSKERRFELESHLMLCFTGFSRIANEIAKSKIDSFNSRIIEMNEMRKMVDIALEILSNRNTPIEEFGKLLDQSWKRKRCLSDRVTTPEIDLIYNTAINAGALGGKILGAGGGGFMLLFAAPEKHAKIREKLKGLVHVDFSFEDSGSKIVLYQPNGL